MTDPGEAVRLFMLEYERPRHRDTGRRMLLARRIAAELSVLSP